MLKKVQLDKVLFLDIETVPQVYQFQDLDEKPKELLDDIKNYYSTLQSIKYFENNLIVNKLFEYNFVDFNVPKPISTLYKDNHRKNTKLLINLCFAKKNIKDRDKMLEKIFTTSLYNYYY